MKKPRILVLDIETSPIISYTWGLFDQNVAINQIVEDWNILSFAAKFVGEDKIYYGDLRNERDVRKDRKLLIEISKLINSADVVLGQNVQDFDLKKINARLLINGLKPVKSVKKIDTMKIAKKYFAMTSNRLEYLSKKLCSKYKKDDHKKFSGFELWKACLAGNREAWKEMEKYNKIDVLSTEELWTKLRPFDTGFNPNLYTDDLTFVCSCGSTDMAKNGHSYTSLGKYQRFTCKSCGAEVRGSVNQLDKDKRKSLMRKV